MELYVLRLQESECKWEHAEALVIVARDATEAGRLAVEYVTTWEKSSWADAGNYDVEHEGHADGEPRVLLEANRGA
jgi:hypothetical protein